MEISRQAPDTRTYLFFLLILFVAVLWAVFLLEQGVVWLSALLFIIAVGMSFFSFTYYKKLRSWIFFYLIVLVALLWAVFLLEKGVFWMSALLFIIAVGMSFFSFMMVDEEKAEERK
jgi:hypothetical protein